MSTFLHIAAAVVAGVTANGISAIWARGEHAISPWLFAMLAAAPVVFITFGLVTARVGLAIGSGVVDSLLTVGTIAVGLIFFREWNQISALQYAGMALALAGIVLMLFFPKP